MTPFSAIAAIAAITKRPLVQLLIATIVFAAGLQSVKHVSVVKKRALAVETEANRIRERAGELRRLGVVTGELIKSLDSSEEVIQSVERLASAEGISLASTQADGLEEREDGFSEEKYSFRLKNVSLGSALRMLASIESTRPGAIIRDLQIRRTVSQSDLVDVDFVVSQLKS